MALPIRIFAGAAGGAGGAVVVGGVVVVGAVGVGDGQPMATKLMANNNANGINSSFFFNCFSSLLRLLKLFWVLFHKISHISALLLIMISALVP